jgi:phosphomannomutase
VDRVEAPAPDVHRLWLADGTRVVLRPSGTEAKFKYYCEAIEPVAAGEEPGPARRRAGERLAAVVDELQVLLG